LIDSETRSSVDKCTNAAESRVAESYPAAAAAAASRAPVTQAAPPPPGITAAAAAAAVSDDAPPWRCWSSSGVATVSQRTLHLHRASETAQGEGTTASSTGSHQLQGTRTA